MAVGTKANEADFFGEGLDPTAAPKAPDATTPRDPFAANKFAMDIASATPKDLEARTASGGASTNPADAVAAFRGGNIGGASGAYNVADAGTKAGYDYMRDIQNPGSVGGFLEGMGQRFGLTGAGDAASLGITNPKDFFNTSGEMVGVTGAGDAAFSPHVATNPIDAVVGNTGKLGAVGASGSVQDMAPGAFDVMKNPGSVVGDALDNALAGGGSIPIDASGADRGGMGLGGAYGDTLARSQGLGDAARATGAGVLGGSIAPGGAGAQGQTDVMGRALGFQPTAQQGVSGELGAFTKQGEGPSQAELLLQKAAQGNMADALSLAHSGRARDAGSAARALNVAQAENAATGIDAGREAALLRAKEQQDFRAQQLQALAEKGKLAQGIDQTGLSALGLGGDLATQLRSGNISERGQTLGFTQGMEGVGAGYEGDVLKTIPQLEQIRHSDEFDLTPQQKLAAAKLGGTPDKTTADYVTALLGDVLSAV